MAITHIASQTGNGYGANTGTVTNSMTFASGDYLLVAIVSRDGNLSGTSFIGAVTWNGVAMTQVYASSNFTSDALGNYKLYVHELVAPATGTHDLVTTCLPGSNDSNMWIGADMFLGVNQTTPKNTNAASSSVTTTATNCMIWNVYDQETTTSENPAPASGQTGSFSIDDTGVYKKTNMRGGYLAAGPTGTYSQTWSPTSGSQVTYTIAMQKPAPTLVGPFPTHLIP